VSKVIWMAPEDSDGEDT